MDLRAIDIGIVPESGPDKKGLVGLPVYLWVDQPAENTYGPITRTVAERGVSVTATAEVDRIEWDMDDGNRVICTTPGTVYEDWYGDRDSPDCGHRYQTISAREPDGVFNVEAASFWTVTWSGGGQSGTLSIDFTNSIPIRVGELQVLVTRGGG